MTCTQPGCTGTIVDGYCDVCGMPGDATSGATPGVTTGATTLAPARPTPSSARAAAPATVGPTPCRQPGCGGTVVDGYCDVCGMAPGDPAVAPTGSESPVSVTDASVPTAAHRLESAAIGSRRAGSFPTKRVRAGSARLRTARLGAGLTVVPPAPAVDPESVVMTDPVLAEGKRFCSVCNAPVGRGQDGRPGRSEGFCGTCGAAFSFTPKLTTGDLVAGQYLVQGALAHGGLGWIYLAKDRNVSDRWVVLKGLLNSGDKDALAAAIAEQRFLAQVEHPLIVEIYNFVTHDDAGYIVMEYVGGTSLKDVLKDRMRGNGGVYDPLPVDQALAYIVEILPAFSYLHDLGLVYCDFKPDNLIQVGDAVKLIDLGGVRHVDDDDSAIYGTVGYQAPEVADVGASIASDIYTIGRTIVVLCMEFKGYQSTYLHSLPDPTTTPLFTAYDSLYWLVAKCCATDPADRFASADELRTQLLGVLREIVAGRTVGTALTSAASPLFEAPTVATATLDWDQLPALRPDPSDPQFGWIASLGPTDPAGRLEQLDAAPERSPEVRLAQATAVLRLAADQHAARPDRPYDTTMADVVAGEMLDHDPWEWRALWVTGLGALARSDWPAAQAAFNAVYQQVPGELAPKLALAVACEKGGQHDVAEGLYATCASTDAAYVAPAAFGLARVRVTRQDTAGAVAALELVPATSRGYGESRRLRAEVLLAGSGGDLTALSEAMRSVDGIRLDPVEREKLSVRILGRALDVVRQNGPARVTIGPYAAEEGSLRDGLEASFRALARETPSRAQRVELVNRANAVRRWSLT